MQKVNFQIPFWGPWHGWGWGPATTTRPRGFPQGKEARGCKALLQLRTQGKVEAMVWVWGQDTNSAKWVCSLLPQASFRTFERVV